MTSNKTYVCSVELRCLCSVKHLFETAKYAENLGKARLHKTPERVLHVVSGTKTLAADHLNPVSCEMEPPWIGCVGPAHHIDAKSD